MARIDREAWRKCLSWVHVLVCGVFLASAGGAWARPSTPLTFEGKPIHPACVQALVMKKGDILPVTTAVDIEGCMTSPRANITPQLKDGIHTIKFNDTLGGGSFSYRILGTLDNGIRILGIRRVAADGTKMLSIAAVDLLQLPALRKGTMVDRTILKLVGEKWVKDFTHGQVQIVGDTVRIYIESSSSTIDRVIDLSRYKGE